MVGIIPTYIYEEISIELCMICSDWESRLNVSKRLNLYPSVNLSLEAFMNERELSIREKDTFIIMLDGAVTVEDLSRKLEITPNTVRVHISNINKKCGSKSRVESLVIFINYLRNFYDNSKIETANREVKKQAVS
ncbi:MAG: hypothetical protein EOP04_00225 [Proteobacteria bacterium]|nr:MAG: hypothetical protein EOP04_00225 [Pseudomonadota bacterium]